MRLDLAKNAVKDPGPAVGDPLAWPDPDPRKQGARIDWVEGLVVYGCRDLGIEYLNPFSMPPEAAS